MNEVRARNRQLPRIRLFQREGHVNALRTLGQEALRSSGADVDWAGLIKTSHTLTDLTDVSVNKLQEIVKDRKAWSAVVHGVAKSWT